MLFHSIPNHSILIEEFRDYLLHIEYSSLKYGEPQLMIMGSRCYIILDDVHLLITYLSFNTEKMLDIFETFKEDNFFMAIIEYVLTFIRPTMRPLSLFHKDHLADLKSKGKLVDDRSFLLMKDAETD